MNRRSFVNILPALGVGSFAFSFTFTSRKEDELKLDAIPDRELWLKTMLSIAQPVLDNLSMGQLKKNMVIECDDATRKPFVYLEAFGRTMNGITPWLALKDMPTNERKLQDATFNKVLKSLVMATKPSSPDFMEFSSGSQPLVDASFLAHSIIKCPALWNALNANEKHDLINCFAQARKIKPHNNNWLLFSAMVEVFHLVFDYPYDISIINNAIQKHEEWYKGDGAYGDGPEFHWDYYNSFVIHPMLLEIAQILNQKAILSKDQYEELLLRSQRYACVLERMVAPDGSYPLLGRSLAYRFGTFHHLSFMANKKLLPQNLPPAQVRSALTAVIKKQANHNMLFNNEGWLRLGLTGAQSNIAEVYINTGSAYLCLFTMQALGLSHLNTFWSDPEVEWTSVKAFNGKHFPIDSAYKKH